MTTEPMREVIEMAKPDTDCRKCGEPMPAPAPMKGILAHAKFTLTAYRCMKCGHWNDLKKRKPRAAIRARGEGGGE